MDSGQIKQVNRFVALARRGRAPGASGGELRAHKLAKAACGMMDNLYGLDADVIDGLCHLIRAGACSPADVREYLESVV